MSNFDQNAILRGAQLTFVGAHRALQNPNLFTTSHYRQAAIAVCAGLAIQVIINIPIYGTKIFLWFLALLVDLDQETWDDTLVKGLDFISKSVLQVPFFLMMVMSSITPTLDNVFMDSLQWVDQTYVQKHKSDDPTTLRAMYYPTLKMYSTHGELEKKEKRTVFDGVLLQLTRYGRRAGISLAIYALTFVPVVGRFVLPAASFYTFNKAVGPVPAATVFAFGLVIPKRYMVSFLQTYFSSRSLMRQLLQPYFHRVRFSKQQKKIWFVDRSGVLFGFSAAFAVMVKVPLFGVLIYGIAEASTAYRHLAAIRTTSTVKCGGRTSTFF
jgi:Etoposide-induced protein 2.4 (EI24)